MALSSCDGAEPDAEPPAAPEDAAQLPRIETGNARFGYTESAEPERATLELLGRSGAELLKVPLGWIRVERQQGTRDWRVYDELYLALLERGIRPLWSLNSAPCWATDVIGCRTGEPTSYPPAPDRIDDFASFAAEVVERYPESLGIEIWNEPNLTEFWRGGADPERYARVLAAAAAAIERADPQMPVSAGGLSPLEHPRRGSLPWPRFTRRALSLAVLAEVDAAAFHPYPSGGPDSNYRAEIHGLLERFRAVLRAGGVERPIWVTETGLSTAGPDGFSPAGQARGLRLILAGLTAMPAVPIIAFHRFVDTPDPDLPREAGYGVIESNGRTPKPAFCAVAAAAGAPCEGLGEPGS